MAVQLEPKGVQPVVYSRLADVSTPVSKRVSINGADSLSSMAVNQGEGEAAAAKDPKATKEDSSRGFCGTLYDIVTAPFRCVAYCAVAVWNFIWCKGSEEEAVKGAEGRKKPAAAEKPEGDAADETPRISGENRYEKAVLKDKFDSDKVEKEFLSLRGKERTRMEHFLWVAMNRPKDFVAKDEIEHASEDQHREAVVQSIAARKLEKFHASTHNLDFSNDKPDDLDRHTKAATKHWDNLLKGNKEGGEVAQQFLQEAVWIARGCADKEGNAVDARRITFANTVEHFDAPVHEMSKRLSQNNMMMLKGKEDRKAFAEFVDSILALAKRGDVTPKALAARYESLKRKSEDAANLLAFCVAQRAQDPKGGEAYVLTDSPEEIQHVINIARQIDLFENGRR